MSTKMISVLKNKRVKSKHTCECKKRSYFNDFWVDPLTEEIKELKDVIDRKSTDHLMHQFEWPIQPNDEDDLCGTDEMIHMEKYYKTQV